MIQNLIVIPQFGTFNFMTFHIDVLLFSSNPPNPIFLLSKTLYSKPKTPHSWKFWSQFS